MRTTMASRPPLHPNRTRNYGFLTSPHLIASSQGRLKLACKPLSSMRSSRSRLRKAFRLNNLRHIMLSSSTAHIKEDLLSGIELEDKPATHLSADTILVVSEGICISIASVFCVASLTMHGSRDSRLVTLSTLEPIMLRKADLPMWQTFFLIAALIINSILRARQWQSRGQSRNSTSKLAVADSNMEGRVQKLEEEIVSSVTIIRVLSKQLEKLAVRFRVTRQTLRDPIQETAVLAQKTSESVNILAARENALEKKFEEMHHVLLRMQENQIKQLELISTLGKLVKDRPRNIMERNKRAGRSHQSEAGSQEVGQGGLDIDGGENLQKKSPDNLGGPTRKRTRGVQGVNIEILEDEVHGKEQSNLLSSPSKPNNLALDSGRMDFWLSSAPVEESTGDDATMKKHF